MATNDISIRPAMQQITIKGMSETYYSPTSSDSHHHHVRRTHAHLLRAPAVASVIWPGEYLQMSIPKELEPDISLALEPCPNYTKHNKNWPRPLNDTTEPKTIARHEHFCQVCQTRTPDIQSLHIKTTVPLPNPSSSSTSSHKPPTMHSATVSVDPDKILPTPMQNSFRNLLETYSGCQKYESSPIFSEETRDRIISIILST